LIWYVNACDKWLIHIYRSIVVNPTSWSIVSWMGVIKSLTISSSFIFSKYQISLTLKEQNPSIVCSLIQNLQGNLDFLCWINTPWLWYYVIYSRRRQTISCFFVSNFPLLKFIAVFCYCLGTFNQVEHFFL